MADNVAITAGSGTSVAADDIGSVFHQRVKLSLGADGTANDAVAGAGAVGVGVQRVTLASDDPAVAGIGGLTETAPASDTASSGLNGRLQRIAQRLTTLLTGWATFGSVFAGRSVLYDSSGVAVDYTAASPVTQSGTWTVGATSVGFDVATAITRPANTTTYTANDVVGGALDLGVLGPSAGSVMITSVQLEGDIAAIPSGQTSWVLYLYSVTPPSALADNAAFDLSSGDRASFLRAVPITTLVDVGATLIVEIDNLNKQVKLAGTKLFGYLVTVGGFAPNANSEVYKVTLHTVAV